MSLTIYYILVDPGTTDGNTYTRCCCCCWCMRSKSAVRSGNRLCQPIFIWFNLAFYSVVWCTGCAYFKRRDELRHDSTGPRSCHHQYQKRMNGGKFKAIKLLDGVAGIIKVGSRSCRFSFKVCQSVVEILSNARTTKIQIYSVIQRTFVT